MTSTDAKLFADIAAALTKLLPEYPEDVIESATQAVLVETGRPVAGYRPGRVTAPEGCNFRSAKQEVLGTVKPGIAIDVGWPEGDWTPVRIRAWIKSSFVKSD